VSHDPAERERALAALAASAVDGSPRFSAVARSTGVSKATLIRWWRDRPANVVALPDPTPRARRAAPPPPAAAPPPPAPPPSSPPVDPDTDRRTFQVWLLGEAQNALKKAIDAESWTPVAALTRRVRDLRNELDELDAEALKAKGGIDEQTVDKMSEEDFVDRLREVAKGTADAYLEVYVAEYMERHGLRFLGATG